jgi:CheY-like chemotaxis protein
LKQWLAQQAQQFERGAGPAETSPPTLFVLVVSAHATIRQLLSELLAGLNCHCDAIGSLELADGSRGYDVLLLDDVWPFEHTLSRLEKWRGEHPAMPIVVGAAIPEGAAREQLRAAGVADFAAKPYAPDDLARCLRRAAVQKV